MNKLLLLFLCIVFAGLAAVSQGTSGHQATASPASDQKTLPASSDEMGFYSPTEVKWKDGPAPLRPGAKFAVLEGEPAKEGPFVMRLWLPDGFKIQPHWHPKVERVTVISGTFNLGMGEMFDQSATREMPAGTFGFWPAGMRHFAWAKGDTVLQLHGIGPWQINYVNPADDPLNAASERPTSSSASNRKSACGCYACGVLLAVDFPNKSPDCSGILATDACPRELAPMPDKGVAYCKEIKRRSKDRSFVGCTELANYCKSLGQE